MTSQSTSPYRSVNLFSHDVQFQMTAALIAIRELKRLRPAICGNALWCWAANNPARDIDIFMSRRWFSAWTVRKFIANSSWLQSETTNNAQNYAFKFVPDLMRDTYYLLPPATANCKPVAVIHIQAAVIPLKHDGHIIPKKKTVLDLVAGPWNTGILATDGFDYHHLQVGWSPRRTDGRGSTFYEVADLCKNRARGATRSRETVLRKVQKSLWGQNTAGHMLNNVYGTLNEMYISLMSPTITNRIPAQGTHEHQN